MEVVKDSKQDLTPTPIITSRDKGKPPMMPKIVICPTYKSLQMVNIEFCSAFGAFAFGVCLITLDEAIELKLPLRKAIEDYENKIAHPIYLANTVEELIPKEYKDSGFTIDLDELVSGWKKNPRKEPQRNDSCPCKSGLKFKKCCLSEV